ncbi:MAG: sigma factor-like helix-turn-helix DNA-binding protein, partial [Kiritimatiellia bacterium]|nr:sigma factor-like helix-turn-helix DNA-binding protein [Kiritimatiellia bacterium]
HEEIAESLGCSVGTVRSRLFYARQQLQRKLAEFAP